MEIVIHRVDGLEVQNGVLVAVLAVIHRVDGLEEKIRNKKKI
ncbi:hypothetical protein L289_0763 [Acinetobacter gerneri DSM 14967 = CIP 107464 = MTCC 9824]|nr:hypothetical protein L289_0763 [Acinetobacter gerneri DSM 14967 = CIP 107464 = MTCC 9824]